MSQINLKCFNWDKNYYIWNVIWNKKKVLDESFKITAVESNKTYAIQLRFVDILGLELNSNLFFNISKLVNIESIFFFYTNFKIFINGSVIFINHVDKKLNFFGNITTVGFGFTVAYSIQTCPFIFLNTKIEYLFFYGLSNTFLKRNKLGFSTFNNSINTIVKKLHISVYKVNLDKKLMSEDIFKNIIFLILNGQFKFIRNNVLNSFKKLIYLELSIKNFINFLDENSKLLHVFKPNRKNFTRVIQIIVDFNDDYQFPNEDFCLFKDFYTSNLTKVFVKARIFMCTETLGFLLRKSNIDMEILEFMDFYKLNLNFPTCLINETTEIRLMEKFLNNCQKPNLIKINSKLTDFDLIYFSEIINTLNFIISPIICLFSILINLLNLKILFNIKMFQRSMKNKLMIVNSLINFLYSVIYCVHLINKCVYVNGIFCSAIMRNKYVQLFDIIFVEFLVGVLKIWSNITIILLSWIRLSRLIESQPIVKKIAKLKQKKIFKFTFGFFLTISILLCVDKLFTVRINENFFVLDYKNYEEFPNKNTFILFLYREVGKHSYKILFYDKQALFFYIIFILNFFINDFLIYFFILLIDFNFLFFINEKFKFKILLAKMLNTKKEKELKNTKQKIARTVCLNLLITFMLKFSYFGVSLYIFIIKIRSNLGTDNIFFNFSQTCSSYLEFSELFYILSIAYSIILFKNLNRNFKESLDCMIMKY